MRWVQSGETGKTYFLDRQRSEGIIILASNQNLERY